MIGGVSAVAILRRGVRLLRVPPADRRLLLEATVEITRASIDLRVAPPSKTATLLGTPLRRDPSNRLAPRQKPEAERIGWMVARVARHLPWHPTCLRQALAVQRMLRRRRIISHLHLGVVSNPVGAAHAWVTVDGQPIIGEAGIERFVPLAAFR
jgi:hypothetical protein